MKQNFLIQIISFFFIFFLCLIFRFLLVNYQNIEPISVFLICLGKRFNYIELFCFGLLNILFFDLFTSTLGVWTLFTSISYALIGIGTFLIKRKKISCIKYSIISTLIYDIVTGLIIGPLIFKQEFKDALIGQIPFSIYHILGNLFLTIIFSLAIELFFVFRLKFILKRKEYLSC